jgi:ferrous iron transport protein A
METNQNKFETNKKEQPLLSPLSTMKSGQEGIVKQVAGGMGFIKKLINIGIRTGSKIQVVNASGGPIIVSSEGTKSAIGKGAASRIFIEVYQAKKDGPRAG